MSPPAIRRAMAADIPALFRIRLAVRENALTMQELAALGVTPESVAHSLATTAAAWITEGEEAGFAMADAADGQVFALFVMPGREGCGIGRALLAAAEAWLAARGWREAWLLTGADPALRADGFYRRMGWREDGAGPREQRLFRRRLPTRGP